MKTRNYLQINCLLIVCTLLFICSCNPSSKKNNDSKIWSLVWEENFDGNTLDTSRFNIIKRGLADWNNTMTDYDECVQQKNGYLCLKGLVNEGKVPQDTSKYLTGGVDTNDKFSFQYGKIEIRAKFNSSTGAWPAIWMLADKPKYGKYPKNGEIDIMEHLNYDSIVYQTVHSYYTLEIGNDTIPMHFGTNKINKEDFNTYSLEWYPDSLVFSVNGSKTFSYPKVENVDSSQWPFDQPFYFMIDMQLGGSWVGNIDPKTLPSMMTIDWVRVYKNDMTK